MTIPNVTPYAGQKPTPGQEQPVFNQNMSDELDYFNSLPEELNPAIDAMNATALQVTSDKDAAAASASSAALAESAAIAAGNYKGEFIVGTTSALLGESYLYNNEIWLCLANTTSTPGVTNSAWKNRFDVLNAIAVSSNVEVNNVDFLASSLVYSNVNYFHEYSSQTTYYSPTAITGTISDTGSDVGGVRTITVDATPYVITVAQPKRTFNFATIADIVEDELKIGDLVNVDNYSSTCFSGPLSFRVVALATGTNDGFKYIDGDSFQFEQILKYPYNVMAAGAPLNGTDDDTAAFQSVYDYVDEGESIVVPNGTAIVSAITGTKNVFWCFDGSTIADDTILQGYVIYRNKIAHNSTTSTDVDTMRINRFATYTGGTAGFVNSAIRAVTNSGPDADAFEWAVIGVVNNASGVGVENVGGYFQGNMQSNGATWGGVCEALDQNYNGNIGRGELVGIEIDNFCNGPDTAGNRVGAQIIVGDGQYTRTGVAGEAGNAKYGLRIASFPGGSDVQFTNGVVVTSATDTTYQAASPNGQRAFRVIGSYGVGLETYEATLTGPAVRAGGGQKISCESNDATYMYGISGSLIFGANTSDKVVVDSTSLRPFTDNDISFGSASYRPTQIFAITGTINTSDARTKTDRDGVNLVTDGGTINTASEPTDSELIVAKKLAKEYGFFKFIDSVTQKGDSARLHCGITVQRVIDIFEEEGLDPFTYGIVCYDEWDDVYEDIYEFKDSEVEGSESWKRRVVDESGNIQVLSEEVQVTKTITEKVKTGTKLVKPAGSLYSLRENELINMVAIGFEARLSALESA
jgi:hypothetical protein